MKGFAPNRGRLLRVIGGGEIASGRASLCVSDGNLDHIYELAMIDGHAMYRAAWRIADGEAHRIPGREWLDLCFTAWETEWTIRLDKRMQREERLKELGI